MNIIEPKGATQIQNGEEQYIDIQYDLYSQGESSGFQIWKLYSLASARVREQFNKICKDMKQVTAYLDVEQYLTKSNLSLEDQLRTGFDDLTLSDCIFHSSMHSMLQDLQVQSGKQLLQRQLKYILEVRLCPSLPFVVEDNEQISAQLTEQNLKGIFDSYAIVTPGFYNVTQPQLPVTRHDNSLPFYSKYKVFKRDSYVATKLIVVYFDTQSNDLDADLCQVCLECKIKGVSREGYFTGNQTSQQVAFTPNKATLYCQNDNLRLCPECDHLLHRGVLQRHTRVDIGGQCHLSQCPRHPDEKLAYEDAASGTFLCTKCVQERTGGSIAGVRSVQQVYADFLADRPGKIGINTELQALYDQQSKIEAVLNNVRAFNTAVEDALLEYFRGIIQQLAAHQNQLVQQLLGQLCLLSRATADLYGQYSFINKQQSNLTANEALAFYRRFDRNRANIKQELSGQILNVQHFVNGLTHQIERFKQAYIAIPQEHLLNMQMMYGRYQHSRLYGLYSKTSSEDPIYVGQDNGKPDFNIEQQKLADKLKDVHTFYDDIYSFKASTDKYSDQLAMNVFNVVKGNANLFTFNLQDQPIYEQLRATMQESKPAVVQPFVQTTTTDQVNDNEQEHYQEEDLNNEQEKQLSQSIFKNTTLLKQSGIDRQKYLDDVYGDNDGDSGLVIHNAVSTQRDYAPVPQASSVSQIFDIASRNQGGQRESTSGKQQNIQQPQNIPSDIRGSVHIPSIDGQRELQESISPNQRSSDAQIPVDINLSTANSAIRNPELTQYVPEKSHIVVQGDRKTLQTSFDNLQKMYKIAERSQQIPSQYFIEAIDSANLRQMLYFQMTHTLKKERQYQKLKLIPVKRKFDRKRGMKFAAIMEICKGAPCMMIVSMHFDTERKQIALSLCSALQQGIVQSKYQFLCDLQTQQLVESQDFTFGPREWSYGDTCIIAKDFAGVKYDGKYWTCDAVDVYCFDE